MRRMQHDSIGWHVIARGTRRLDLFREAGDYTTFLSMLRFSLVASGATLWGFTLMSNHYHMLIHASTQVLTACMMRLNRSYSHYHNLRYDLVGHAFDGPYRAYPQGSPLILLRTLAYIFQNPVVAGIALLPEQYQWSCARDFLALPGSPLRVDPWQILSRVSSDPRTAWECFHRAMDREAKRAKRPVADSLTRVQVHAQQFEWLLEHAKESMNLLASDDPIAIAVYWGRRCGITPKAMATILGLDSSKPVYRMLEQMNTRLKKDPTLMDRLALP